jgi:hypothetical protein
MATRGRLISSMPFQSSSKNVGRRALSSGSASRICAMLDDSNAFRTTFRDVRASFAIYIRRISH